MKHVIRKRCVQKIDSFYHNVSRKYKHSYSEELMHKNADEAFDAMYQIEVSRWRNRYSSRCLPCPKHEQPEEAIVVLLNSDKDTKTDSRPMLRHRLFAFTEK